MGVSCLSMQIKKIIFIGIFVLYPLSVGATEAGFNDLNDVVNNMDLNVKNQLSGVSFVIDGVYNFSKSVFKGTKKLGSDISSGVDQAGNNLYSNFEYLKNQATKQEKDISSAINGAKKLGMHAASNISENVNYLASTFKSNLDIPLDNLKSAGKDLGHQSSGQVASVSSTLAPVRCFLDPIFSIFTKTPEGCRKTSASASATSTKKILVSRTQVVASSTQSITATTSITLLPKKQESLRVLVSTPSLVYYQAIKGYVNQQEFQSQISLLKDAVHNLRNANTTVYVSSGGSYSVAPISNSSVSNVDDKISAISTSLSNQITALQNSIMPSQWFTGTSSQIYFTAGNVGIGTTTPGSNLTVSGTGLFTGNVTANAYYGDGSNLTGITSFSTSTTRSVFSNSASGLTYNSSTGSTSLTVGYVIPLVASTTEWVNKISSQWISSGSNIYFNAGNVGIGTTTSASALTVAGDFNFTGNIYKNGSLFNTDTLIEGTNNLYFTNVRVNNILSATTTLPNITTLVGLSSVGIITSGTWNGAVIGDAYLTKSGDWAGTFDGQEGIYYLARANQTGTQLASTISDFSTTALNLISSSASGLSYATSTGIFSITSGYNIPLTASTTEWFAASASTTALNPTYLRSLFSNSATGLTYANGVTSLTSGYSIPLTASITDFQTAFINRITSASSPLSISGNVISISTMPTFASTTLSNFTAGSIPFFATGGSLNQNNTNLFWDNANGRLGIGTTNPGYPLTVSAAVADVAKFVSTTNHAQISIDSPTNFNSGFVFKENDSYRFLFDYNSNITSGNRLADTFELYSYASSQPIIRVSESAPTSLVISSTGNIGIGTTTPSAKLAVLGTTEQLRLNYDSSNFTKFTVGSASGLTITPGVNGVNAFNFTKADGSTAVLNVDSTNGSVGIGSSTPISTLSVVGVGGINPFTVASSTGNPLMVMSQLGFLGIGGGTAAPQATLHVTRTNSGNSTTQLILQNSATAASTASVLVFDNSTNLTNISAQIAASRLTDASNDLVFGLLNAGGTNVNERMRILGATGFVGIGSTTPNSRLVVQGQTGSTTDVFVVASSTNTSLLKVDYTGGLSVAGLSGCGGIQTNAGGLMSCSSDATLKNIQGDFTQGLEAIRGIVPQSFSWKQSSPMYDGGVVYHGFIAQNVQQFLPEAVNVGASGKLQVSQLVIQATLVNALKEIDQNVQLLGATSRTDVSGNKTFLGKILDRISIWFGDFSNGISDFFANRVHTKTLCVGDSSSGETCINKEQLDHLLQNAGSSPVIQTDTQTGPTNTITSPEPVATTTVSDPVVQPPVEVPTVDVPATVETPIVDTPPPVDPSPAPAN